jgi:hypothetical protein
LRAKLKVFLKDSEVDVVGSAETPVKQLTADKLSYSGYEGKSVMKLRKEIVCGQKRPRKEHSDEVKEAMVIYSVVLVTGV